MGAILTQSTRWANAEKALVRLKEAGALSPQAVRDLPPERLALRPTKDTYKASQDLFHRSLPRDPALFQEYHALLVCLGKGVCRRRDPCCPECPLRDLCPAGQGAPGSRSGPALRGLTPGPAHRLAGARRPRSP